MDKTNKPDIVAFISENCKKEKFKYFQPKVFYLHSCFSEENKIVYLQLYLLYSDNNQSKNNIWKAFEPNELAWSSNFLYL